METVGKVFLDILGNLYLPHYGTDVTLLISLYRIFSPVSMFDFDGVQFTPIHKRKAYFWALICFYFLFEDIRYMQILLHLYHIKNLNDTFVMVFWILCYTYGILHYIHCYIFRHEFAQGYNAWINLRLEGRTEFYRFHQILIRIGTTISIMTIVVCWKFPWTPYFLLPSTGLTLEDPIVPYLMPLFFVYQVMPCYLIFGTFMTCDAFHVGFCESVTKQLEAFCLKSSDGDSSPRLTIQKALKYKSLYIFVVQMNQCLGFVFMYRKLCIHFQLAYLNVMVVAALGSGDPVFIIHAFSQVMPIYLIVGNFFGKMSTIHSKSVEVLGNWKIALSSNNVQSSGSLELKGLSKEFECLRPFQFSSSGMYGIKSSTILSYLDSVTCNTISILITLQESQT